MSQKSHYGLVNVNFVHTKVCFVYGMTDTKMEYSHAMKQEMAMNVKCYFIYLRHCVLTVIAVGIAGYAIASDDLSSIIEKLKTDYDIQHISSNELNKLSDSNLVIFDVRRPVEYQVGHLKNAIHLDPSTSPDSFLQQHGENLKDKTVVFYCSVGQRSSRMLSKLNNVLEDVGVKQAYNLEGGAFRWHNENFSFVKNGKDTRDIHPYNAYYGRLVDDKSSIKYK